MINLIQCDVGLRRIQLADLQPCTEIALLAALQCRNGLARHKKTVLQVLVLGRTSPKLDVKDYEKTERSILVSRMLL